jgi:hypothetical protein
VEALTRDREMEEEMDKRKEGGGLGCNHDRGIPNQADHGINWKNA